MSGKNTSMFLEWCGLWPKTVLFYKYKSWNKAVFCSNSAKSLLLLGSLQYIYTEYILFT